MRNLLAIAVVLFFAGCSFRPDLPSVDTKFEASYEFETTSINDKWWEEFGDENLNSLIQDALKNNIDLKMAFLNLQKAEQNFGVASADLFPTITLNGGATRAKTSGESYTKQKSTIYNNFVANLGLNYEIDLWGRVKNSVEAAKSNLKASKFDYDGARVSIASSVAKSYFALVGLNMRKELLEKTLQSYKETANLRQNQLNLGSIDNITFLQSKAQVQNTELSLNQTKNSISLALTSLSIMSGKSNDEILKGAISSAKNLPNEPQIAANIGSDILLKRSDVASAYERLKSTNALVGVAKSAYLPTISLTGIFGFVSDELGRLFVDSANAWSLGGSITQKIFDYKRTSSNVKVAQTNEQIAALAYEKAVKVALGETRDALIQRENAKKLQENVSNLLKSQEQIYKIAQSRFDEGYISHLELLDAQRNLLATKLENININLNAINAIVDVFKAFGGGFKVENLDN